MSSITPAAPAPSDSATLVERVRGLAKAMKSRRYPSNADFLREVADTLVLLLEERDNPQEALRVAREAARYRYLRKTANLRLEGGSAFITVGDTWIPVPEGSLTTQTGNDIPDWLSVDDNDTLVGSVPGNPLLTTACDARVFDAAIDALMNAEQAGEVPRG